MINFRYKTFDDLKFAGRWNFWKHCNMIDAKIQFQNNYGASVIWSDKIAGFELLIMSYSFEQNEWVADYQTPLTNDVFEGLDIKAVTEVMRRIQDLPPKLGVVNAKAMRVTDEVRSCTMNENAFEIEFNRRMEVWRNGRAQSLTD